MILVLTILLAFVAGDVASDGKLSAKTVDPIIAERQVDAAIKDGKLVVRLGDKVYGTAIAPLDYSKMND